MRGTPHIKSSACKRMYSYYGIVVYPYSAIRDNITAENRKPFQSTKKKKN